MNIHEYQAKELFKLYDIPVSTGSVAYSSNEIETAVNNVSGPTWVVRLKFMLAVEEKVVVLRLSVQLVEQF